MATDLTMWTEYAPGARQLDAIRDDRYKLVNVVNPTETLVELYDLEADPTEQVDLLGPGVGDLSPDALDALTALEAARTDLMLSFPQP